MERRRALERWLVWLDFVAILVFALGGVWLVHISNEAAAEAVRLYGHNVDSGAYTYIAAIIYCFPNAVLFAVTSTAMARGWRLRWLMQFAVLFWLVVPVVWVFIPRGASHAV